MDARISYVSAPPHLPPPPTPYENAIQLIAQWTEGARGVTLDLSSMGLTELPELPEGVIVLDCSLNELTALPSLPNSLVELNCTHNDLVTLPPLSPALRTLMCGYNDLITLPDQLPLTLWRLEADHCLLNALPALPLDLIALACGYNNLTALPALPDTLLCLLCPSNKLRVLPALPPELQFLVAANNEMVVAPAFLPDTLTTLSLGQMAPIRLTPRPSRLKPIRPTALERIVELPPSVQRLGLPNWDCAPELAPPQLVSLGVAGVLIEGLEEIQAAWLRATREKHAALRRRLGAHLPAAAMLFL